MTCHSYSERSSILSRHASTVTPTTKCLKHKHYNPSTHQCQILRMANPDLIYIYISLTPAISNTLLITLDPTTSATLASNFRSVSSTTVSSQGGQVAWRFKISADCSRHRSCNIVGLDLKCLKIGQFPNGFWHCSTEIISVKPHLFDSGQLSHLRRQCSL
jgi:hypothetical protein